VGKKDFPEKYNPDNQKWLTIPWMLKSIDLNYRTAHYGKWDIRADLSPENFGYDESDGDTRNDNGDRITDKSKKFTEVLITGDPKRTVSLTRRALNFMQRQVSSGHPFYMQVSYYATHVDLETKKDTYQKYLNKKKGTIQKNAGFAGMLQDMDTGIGEILDLVQQLGIADDTYIFFLTDNGGVESFPPPHARYKLDRGKTYNYPLRGGKWTTYEGGIRVPFIVEGPGISPHSYCHIPVREFDILPTISDLAGNNWKLPGYIDGGSLRPLFKDPEEGKVVRPKEDFYFHRFTNSYLHSAIIEGDYKLLIRWSTSKGFKENKVELYNLKNDVGENDDLSAKMPEKVSALKRKLISYLEKENIDIPQNDIQDLLKENK
jgi:arylsulfatase A-like enzyme